ncbi:MAG: CpsD/CapB family tyrosine-protein kinase [Phycisphaerae bacterium]|nr:CpsD/CapB family tyrosine-protein kinase [Phycisphaerae bacterium]
MTERPGKPDPFKPEDSDFGASERGRGPREGDVEPEPDYGEDLSAFGGDEPLTPTPMEPEPAEEFDLERELEAEARGSAETLGLGAGAAPMGAEPVGGPPRAGFRRPAKPAERRVRAASQRELGQLWGSVFFAVDRPPPKIVAFTAAMRNEGVTQVATALAMAGASAQRDLRIALVDCNLRHSRIAALLSLEGSPGVTDVVSGRARIDDAIQAIETDAGHTLGVLPAGSEDGQPLGLLRSRQFKGLLGALRERFDHVIVDTPATNLYPDPQIIGALSDGAVMVVRAARTQRHSVAEAKKRLELAQCKLVGVVLNQRTYPIPGFIYRNI